MEGDKAVESTSKAFESERSGCFSVSNMGDEDFDRNATTDLFKQADASGLFNVPPFERSTNQSVSAAELAENRVLQLEAKVKVLEKRLEEWGKRCDEADSVEEDLRLQLYKNSEAWKIERLSLMQKLEALKEENERLRNDIFEMNGTDRADKLELENLRSAKRMWTKEKKEKDEEIATLTSRIIALRKELRRIVAKNSEDLSPSSSVLLSSECRENAEAEVTPTRKVDRDQQPPATSKKKSNRSGRSFRNELCEPFSLEDSL